MGEWQKVSLNELGEVIGGATPSTKDDSYYGGGIPWITPKDLSNYSGRYISRGERNITEKGLKGCSAKLMPVNTILFTSRAPIGYIAISSVPVCTNQGFKSIVPNKDTDSKFLYYLLKYNKDMIESMGSGTTFKEVSGSTMKNIEVIVPENKDEQIRIGEILSCFDDKIELNNKINDYLSQMAQAIFKSWFVDFEPFKDGEFAHSELGMIPKGWCVGNLFDIAQYLNGLAMQKFRPSDSEKGIPVLKIKELRQGSFDDSSELCSENIKSEYIIHDGDVIFSWSGSLLVDFWCSGICGLNQHLFKVTSDTYDKWFYYIWTNYHLQKFIAIAADKATTMGHIKREDLASSLVLIPDTKSYNKIGRLLAPIYEQIIKNRIENRKLADVRDNLLPKLMSGELSVADL